jgi:drug/metabolite transporter (DMT)-like permease
MAGEAAMPVSELTFWRAVDVAGSLTLVVAAYAALRVGKSRPRWGRWFWIGAAAGLTYLAADERFSLHERLGQWLHRQGTPTPMGLNHLDDAVLLAIAVAGLAFTLVFAREVGADRRFAAMFGAALAITAAALMVDAMAPVEGGAPRVEELLEFAGQAAFAAAFALRMIRAGVSPAWLPRLAIASTRMTPGQPPLEGRTTR